MKRLETIKSGLDQAMPADRRAIINALRSLGGRRGRGLPPEEREKRIKRLEKKLRESKARRLKRERSKPALFYPEHLPIMEKRSEIVRAVQELPVIVVSGETGSGKSTQIPKMCLEAGRGVAGKIACTQPRRIAATTVAARIAEELGEDVGQSVGYRIRFKDRTHRDGYIKILTDGMLLAETQQDRFLNEYDTLIIDEAHERSLNIDFLLGLIRTLVAKRRDLKVVITSATLDTEKFSEAFDGAPVIHVGGRLYPVEVEYRPPEEDPGLTDEATYVDAAVWAAERLVSQRTRGDILVFMPTEQDIRETCERLEARWEHGVQVLPLFARLPASQQSRVFKPAAGRKIVVATNVAETSLTIPGIRYVIDTGLARIPRYLPTTRTTTMGVVPISRSSADQRMGRCGRVEDGVCIRLYSEEDYLGREEYTPPEILRSNLAEVILRMLSLRLGEIHGFPFVDRPSARSIKDGYDLLTELGAIRREKGKSRLTGRGRLMAKLPLDPRISRMMIEAQKEGCLEETAIIASALGVQDPKERPAEAAGKADAAHRSFSDPQSDFLALLNIWRRCRRASSGPSGRAALRRFCKENHLSFRRMREWEDVYEQLRDILEEEGMTEDSGPRKGGGPSDDRYDRIHRAITSGFLSNIAVRKEKNIYKASRGREVMLFPGSGLFNSGAEWIVAAEMVKTSRLFARTAARIDPRWLEPLGGKLCRTAYHAPHWEKNRGEVVVSEQVTLFGLVIVSGRPVSYGRVDPEDAHRIFVRSALVEGDIKEDFEFLRHNRELLGRLASLEDKLRRRDILAGQEAVEAFYSERLPGVYDIRTLKRRLREKGGDDFLKMREEDVMARRPDEEALSAFPDHTTLGDRALPFTYRFQPGSDEDGVTLSVPATLASRFPAERLDWVVPGLFEEKVTALIKGLPKRYRRNLVPVSETVKIITSEMERGSGSLLTELGRFIHRRFGVDIPASAWPGEELPEHLRMRVAVTDHRGRELRAGRDPSVLRQEDGGRGVEDSEAWEKARKAWERDGLSGWDFDRLPEEIPLDGAMTAYPALEPSEAGVRIRLFPDAGAAAEAHRRGVARLMAAKLRSDLKFARRGLRLPIEAEQAATYFGGRREIEQALERALITHLFSRDVRTREYFEKSAQEASAAIIPTADRLLDSAAAVLQAYHRVRALLHSIEAGRPPNPAAAELCAGIRRDLDRLVPPDFLERYPFERLRHLPRYLKAMEIRAERGSYDPEKDRKKAGIVREFKEELDRMESGISRGTSGEKRAALEEFRRMLEELRVSVFAPELSTAIKVSPKRLRKKAEEIDRML
ncbi:MAG: ATP-dependent RNA helicase HrpA [Desulfobacteraceae bacterium]